MDEVGFEAELDARYRSTGAAVLLAIEREALGSDYQANGYTTRTDADEIGDLLDLGPGARLLDLGSGCGWPGLYLADRHGCDVVTIDPVASGVAVSADRARRDGLDARHLAIVAAGDELPLRPGSFDAVVHVDVLC